MTRKAGNAGWFKKGDDNRRNKNGQISKEKLDYGKRFDKAFMRKVPPETLAAFFARRIERGDEKAAEYVADRFCGKTSQPIDVNGRLTVKVVQVKDQNGNGNSGK